MIVTSKQLTPARDGALPNRAMGDGVVGDRPLNTGTARPVGKSEANTIHGKREAPASGVVSANPKAPTSETAKVALVKNKEKLVEDAQHQLADAKAMI